MPDTPSIENVAIVVTAAKSSVQYSKNGAANIKAIGDSENDSDNTCKGKSLKSSGACSCRTRPCCHKMQSCTHCFCVRFCGWRRMSEEEVRHNSMPYMPSEDFQRKYGEVEVPRRSSLMRRIDIDDNMSKESREIVSMSRRSSLMTKDAYKNEEVIALSDINPSNYRQFDLPDDELKRIEEEKSVKSAVMTEDAKGDKESKPSSKFQESKEHVVSDWNAPNDE